MHRPPTRLGSAATAIAAAVLTAGIVVTSLASGDGSPPTSRGPTPLAAGLRTPNPGSSVGSQPTVQVKPSLAPTSPPTPWATPAVVSYVIPVAASFPSPADGWVLGDACDQQNRCEVAAARTTDGGTDWTIVDPPVAPEQGSFDLQMVAASAEDAWVWGTDSDGARVFTATHDGGRTWQPAAVGPMVVADLAIDGSTIWAVVGCPTGAVPCSDRVLSSPVAAGAWADLGPLPLQIAIQPQDSVFPFPPQLIRVGGRAWVLTSTARLLRGDASARNWSALFVPCEAPMSPLAISASSADALMLVCGLVGVWPAPQEIWASSDGGTTWVLRSREYASLPGFSRRPDVGSLGSQGLPSGVVMIGTEIAWLWGDREQDLVSRDGGATWIAPRLPYGGWGGAEGVNFADAEHGWTYGSYGLWATSDGGTHWRYQPIIGPIPGVSST